MLSLQPLSILENDQTPGSLGLDPSEYFFFCKCVIIFCLNVCLCVLHACLVPMKVRKECQISWNYSYSWLSVTMWVLGTDSQGSATICVIFMG